MSDSGEPRIAAVLLAAGAARRFGRAKQVEIFEGRTLVRGAAEAALAVSDQVIVVTGSHAEAVEIELADLPVQILRCEDWALGMGHSIACAFRALLESTDRPDSALLCLADQPLVREPQLRRLVETAAAAPSSIVIADYGTQRGPPAVFPQRFYSALAKLEGDEGARSVIRKHAGEVLTVAMREAALDVDTPEDYERAIRR